MSHRLHINKFASMSQQQQRAPLIPAGEKFKYFSMLSTRYKDEDNQRVLNNAVYMSLFEEARCRYFGKPVLNLLPDSFQFPFVLHSTTVRFVAPGSGARENVKVYIKTTKISKSSLQQLYRVEHDGVIWCEASAILVGWNVKLKKKADFTDHFRQTVSMFEGITPDSPAPAKLPPANSTIVSTFFQKEKRALKVGDKASIVKTFTPADVSAFAELSEDRNPIHLDTAFAATTRFGKPIVHGALAVSLISALLGSTLPGEGTVYVSQNTQFRSPLPVGDSVKAEVVVKDINLTKNQVTLTTICSNAEGKIISSGEAVVMVPKILITTPPQVPALPSKL